MHLLNLAVVSICKREIGEHCRTLCLANRNTPILSFPSPFHCRRPHFLQTLLLVQGEA